MRDKGQVLDRIGRAEVNGAVGSILDIPARELIALTLGCGKQTRDIARAAEVSVHLLKGLTLVSHARSNVASVIVDKRVVEALRLNVTTLAGVLVFSHDVGDICPAAGKLIQRFALSAGTVLPRNRPKTGELLALRRRVLCPIADICSLIGQQTRADLIVDAHSNPVGFRLRLHGATISVSGKCHAGRHRDRSQSQNRAQAGCDHSVFPGEFHSCFHLLNSQKATPWVEHRLSPSDNAAAAQPRFQLFIERREQTTYTASCNRLLRQRLHAFHKSRHF